MKRKYKKYFLTCTQCKLLLNKCFKNTLGNPCKFIINKGGKLLVCFIDIEHLYCLRFTHRVSLSNMSGYFCSGLKGALKGPFLGFVENSLNIPTKVQQFLCFVVCGVNTHTKLQFLGFVVHSINIHAKIQQLKYWKLQTFDEYKTTSYA